MPTECCVPGCTKRTGHLFPWSNQKRVKAWKVAVKRDCWEPTKYSVVCGDHFDEKNDYECKTTYGTVPLQKRLKKTAVPHIFSWTKQPTPADVHRGERCRKRLQMEIEREKQRDVAVQEFETEEIVTTEETCVTDVPLLPPQDMSSQTDGVCTCKEKQSVPVSFFTANRYAGNSKAMHFFTGLENYNKFCMVLQTLGPAAYELNYFHNVMPSLSIEDQFFLSLVKLRQHKTNFELSTLFDIREDSVTNIFVTWINFMYYQWGEINWWPSGDLVRFYSPTDIKQKFPSTRVIIDGTECPMQKPKEPVIQQATFSTYKNRNTMKVLVGMSPGGLTTYVSPAYGGSVSDRQICERSALPQMCDPGDSIMADKGFNVQDLFEEAMVSINIPTFFHKKNRLSGGTVIKDRKIASKRVHIERIIGLCKTYKILQRPMNNTESTLATQIIQVCFYLCNFRSNIVSQDA